MPVMSDEESSAVKSAYSGEPIKLIDHLKETSSTSKSFRQEVAKYILHLVGIIKPGPVESRDRRPM
jgi:hypothetical protein